VIEQPRIRSLEARSGESPNPSRTWLVVEAGADGGEPWGAVVAEVTGANGACAAERDARLFAAAPDLFDAVRRLLPLVVDFVDSGEGGEGLAEAFRIACRAHAKAQTSVDLER
jgi:hypothetical protein